MRPDKKSMHKDTGGQEETSEPVVLTSQPDQNENQVSDEIINFSGARTTYLTYFVLSCLYSQITVVFNNC